MPNQSQETLHKAIMLLRAEADENERRVSDFRKFAEQLQTLSDKETQQPIMRK